MKTVTVAVLITALTMSVLLVESGFGGPWQAQGAPPSGVALVVDTSIYPGVTNDGLCSLNEAINAANTNSIADGTSVSCSADQSSPGATDYIVFNIGPGTPVINITSPSLPPITDKLNINGSTNADRVELRGPGFGNGLVMTYGSSTSVISGLAVNSFQTGIYVAEDNVSVRGNYIGTDGSGTSAQSNVIGIYLDGADDVQVGGTAGVIPGGPCTGYCNLISGNIDEAIKIGGGGASGVSRRTVIEGNFIGTNVQGTSAIANTDGIYFENGDARIGGATAESGNLISGNTLYGVDIPNNANAAGTIVRGNRIGTKGDGQGPIANGTGIGVGNATAIVIGAPGGPPNVISGNTGDGVYTHSLQQITLQNSLIGTGLDGITPVPNGGRGLDLHYLSGGLIGGAGAGEANTIAFNGSEGVYLGTSSFHTSIRGNAIFSNGAKGIRLEDSTSNDGLPPPTISGASNSEAHGLGACAFCIVDVYSDSEDEGRIYEGSTIADNFPIPVGWTFTGALHGPNITVTTTDSSGNSSEFSAPFALPATPTSSPSPTTSPSPTPSPTPTATQTQTPVPTASPIQTTVTATASPNEELLGDANCDGIIDTDDIIAALSEMAGIPPGACGAPANTDCDGDIDAFDALLIVIYLADLPPNHVGICPRIGDPVS